MTKAHAGPAVGPARILHVTESMAAGVMFALRSYATEQVASGAQVRIVHMRRPDSPPPAELRRLFPEDVELEEFSGRGRIVDLLRMSTEVFRMARGDAELSVHAHSSFAGATVRIAALLGGFARRTFYSPHGFAFLRQDLTGRRRALIARVERLLASQCSQVVVLSKSELEECTRVGIRNAVLIENGVDLSTLPMPLEARTRSNRLRVSIAARVTPQKSPRQFAEVAAQAVKFADFTWIGASPDGAAEDEDLLRQAGVEVTGWVDRAGVIALLEQSHVYLSLSLWEGMPLALLEAQCLGVPAVVLDTIGNRDVVAHEVTGFVVDSTDDALLALQRLADDPELYARFAQNALDARSRFDQRRLGPRYLDLYLTGR